MFASFLRPGRSTHSFIDPSTLAAYTSCRLIPLNKCPGVRPIGIGEVVRRIIGKAVMRVMKYDLQDSIGNIQLCAGQDAGCEAAVHSMEKVFADENTEAMILVDASNALEQTSDTSQLQSNLPCSVVYSHQHLSQQLPTLC